MESVVVKSHLSVVDAEAVQMLRDFVEEPQNHMGHPKRFSNSIIMSLGRLSVVYRLQSAHANKYQSVWNTNTDH